MRIATIVVALVVGGGLLSLALVFARWGESPPPTTAPAAPPPVEDPDALPVADAPPYPRAVVDRTDLDFGFMEVYQQGKHVFRITNKGEAPLQLKKGKTTCQCTLSKVAEQPIPPGQTAEIELTWKPESQTDMFDKGATIYTNDPNLRKFVLNVRGHVMQRLEVSPSGNVWNVEDVSDSSPSVIVGNVFSRTVKSFQVTSAESGHPSMKAEVLPMPENMRAQLNAASGYSIKVTVEPGKSAGSFAYPLKIVTDLKERLASGELGEKDMTIDVSVRGNRQGAITFFGAGYDPTDTGFVLGNFLSKEGRTKELRMIVSHVPESGVKIVSVKSVPEHLKVEITPEGAMKPGKRSQHFKVRLSYAPNGPLVSHSDASNPALVTITTDHPDVPEIQLKVYFSVF